jgi:hypothetical protein
MRSDELIALTALERRREPAICLGGSRSTGAIRSAGENGEPPGCGRTMDADHDRRVRSLASPGTTFH